MKSEAWICKTATDCKKHENMVNLRDRDNLQREDKGPVPKVSSLRRFDYISVGQMNVTVENEDPTDFAFRRWSGSLG